MKATLQNETRQNAPERAREFVIPEVNIFETPDGYLIEADMPGVGKDGMEIMLEGNEITIVGHRRVEQTGGEPLFRESTNADYRRVFELDPAVDTRRITAQIDQGVLKVSLPKSERVKPRRIDVE